MKNAQLKRQTASGKRDPQVDDLGSPPPPAPAPECASGQPGADVDPVVPDARAPFGAACATILRRAELTEERPPFAPSALRCLATRRGTGGRPRGWKATEAMRMRAAGAGWREVYAALDVPSSEQRLLRERTYKRTQRARRRAQQKADKQPRVCPTNSL